MSLYALSYGGDVISEEDFTSDLCTSGTQTDIQDAMKSIGNIYEKKSDAYTASCLQDAIEMAKRNGKGYYPYEIETLSDADSWESVRSNIAQSRQVYVIRMIYNYSANKLMLKPVQLNVMNCYAGVETIYQTYADCERAIKAFEYIFTLRNCHSPLKKDDNSIGTFLDAISMFPNDNTEKMPDDDLPF